MNQEICKKCGVEIQLRETSHGGYTLACFGPSKKRACFIEFMFSNDAIDILANSKIIKKSIECGEEFGTFNNYWLKFNNKIKRLQQKEINDCCPYYIEHQLFDWNENECKDM